jgi:hypothetical protein
MGVDRLRGPRPPISPVTTKPAGTEQEDNSQQVEHQTTPGVLKPGQRPVLPARTGLSHFPDHFDARSKPDYDKQLKGETKTTNVEHEAASHSDVHAEPPADDDAARTAFAQDAALELMSFLPPSVVSDPGALLATRIQRDDVDAADEDEKDEGRSKHQHPGAWADDEDADPDDEHFDEDAGEDERPSFEFALPEPERPVVARSIELQGGLFTLDEGSLDAKEHRLCTLEAFLDGDVPFVSVAVDLEEIPYGAALSVPSLDAALGRHVVLRAVHQNERTEGCGSAYVEICVSERTAENERLFERLLTVQVG